MYDPMDCDPHTECDCGHERCWHAEDDGEGLGGMVGHYCTYEGCECMGFFPAVEESEG